MGLRDRKLPSGSRGQGPGETWGQRPQNLKATFKRVFINHDGANFCLLNAGRTLVIVI